MKVLFVLFLAIATACCLDLRTAEVTQTKPVIIPEQRITNGLTVPIEKYNYQVGLAVGWGSWCGGSLIKTTYILTAAHCVYGLSPGSVTAFMGNATRTLGTTRVAKSITVHEAYNPTTLLNDLALIKIDPVVLSTSIGVVTLPPTTAGTYDGSIAVATGWGKTSDAALYASDTLQAANLQVVANAVCQASYGAVVVQPSTLCVSTPKGTSTCQGDSGGPLVLLGTRTLIGVTSFVLKTSCVKGYPAGFSRVSSYLTWIANNSKL